MRIGLFTAGYRRNALCDAFEDAARFRYDYIELLGERPHAYPPDMDAETLSQIRGLSRSFGIPVLGYTPSLNSYPYNFMLGNEKMRRESLDYIKRAIDAALELGAEFTAISPGHAGYDTPYDGIWNRLVKSVAEIAEYAQKADHTVLIEALTPFESNTLTTANDLCRLLDTVPSPNLKAMCDIVPPFVQHESILSYIVKLGPRLRHLHLVDSDGASAMHLVPSEGIIPMRELVGQLRLAGYNGTATIELVTHYMHEPRLYAQRAIETLRKMMQDAGAFDI
ncbi:MAG: fructoselysine 3-epimerase [Clostridiaceae bacterium]|nr:fructoselysine 3-epimerase [Eubacteriales bacterium]